jgi:hypothetical protein
MVATRVCTKCNQEKPIEDFPWKSKLLNRRHAVCKPCAAKRSNKWYKSNKDLHIQNVMKNKRADRQEARQFVWDYLSSHPCIDCGENDPVVLEFDHVNGKKENVSNLVANGASVQRLKLEIDLCEVRCSNCHRRKTSREKGWFSG